MEEKQDFKTPWRVKKEKTELEIYTRFMELIQKPGASKIEVAKFLCKEYNIATISTIYGIRKRVEKRLQDGTK